VKNPSTLERGVPRPSGSSGTGTVGVPLVAAGGTAGAALGAAEFGSAAMALVETNTRTNARRNPKFVLGRSTTAKALDRTGILVRKLNAFEQGWLAIRVPNECFRT
jgi:hypothetical protein